MPLRGWSAPTISSSVGQSTTRRMLKFDARERLLCNVSSIFEETAKYRCRSHVQLCHDILENNCYKSPLPYCVNREDTPVWKRERIGACKTLAETICSLPLRYGACKDNYHQFAVVQICETLLEPLISLSPSNVFMASISYLLLARPPTSQSTLPLRSPV